MPETYKIAIVCNYALHPDRIGGMDRFYIAYDAALKEAGYEVHWYFSNYKPYDFFSGLTIFDAGGKDVESLFLNKMETEKINYIFLITHFVALCTSFFKNAKKEGIKHIIAVDHNPRPLEGFSFSKKAKNKIKGMLFSRYIDQFIGVSDYTTWNILNDYGSFLKKKTKTIHNGIQTSIFIKRSRSNKNKFFVASHLRHSKGIQDLLKALNLLDNNVKSNIVIDIYGEGPMEDELTKISEGFNLTDSVKFKGSISNLNEVAASYSYMIQPTYMECFSLSILESLAANVPVITTDVGGNLEVMKDHSNGFIFKPGDYTQLAKIINDIFSDTIGIEDNVSNLIESQFNLEIMVKAHMKIILDYSL